jgi:hypothetical protein
VTTKDDEPRRQAEQLWERLAGAGAGAEDYDEADDLAPKVETTTDAAGRPHFYVGFNLKGRGVWLAPDDARDFADELLAAADKAEALTEEGTK